MVVFIVMNVTAIFIVCIMHLGRIVENKNLNWTEITFFIEI